MTKQPAQAEIASRYGAYLRPTLSLYGGVVGLTAAGTQPPTENSGTGGAIKRP